VGASAGASADAATYALTGVLPMASVIAVLAKIAIRTLGKYDFNLVRAHAEMSLMMTNDPLPYIA
jgi:hypothetical protein